MAAKKVQAKKAAPSVRKTGKRDETGEAKTPGFSRGGGSGRGSSSGGRGGASSNTRSGPAEGLDLTYKKIGLERAQQRVSDIQRRIDKLNKSLPSRSPEMRTMIVEQRIPQLRAAKKELNRDVRKWENRIMGIPDSM